MLTTIIVTPRERFSVFVRSLESLFSTIPADTPVIVFNGGAPEPVKSQLRALRQKRDFDLHETDGFLLPPQVRNRAVPMVKTRYTCFCDNDVFYTPGWLEALEANAEANGSGAVAPLTLIGPSSDPIIHHAGSELSVAIDRRGRPRLNSLHRLDGTPYREAVANDFAEAGVDCDEFEYHCAFVRTDVLAEIGGHDERQTKHDHLNDSLRIRMLGHRITFEKNAVITYHAFEPFTELDWPYFFYRWSEQASIDSERAIGSCWGARKNYEERELNFVTLHRRRVVATSMPRWIRKSPLAALGDRLLEARIRQLHRRYDRAPPQEQLHVPPAPPADGLARAGIKGSELLERLRVAG